MLSVCKGDGSCDGWVMGDGFNTFSAIILSLPQHFFVICFTGRRPSQPFCHQTLAQAGVCATCGICLCHVWHRLVPCMAQTWGACSAGHFDVLGVTSVHRDKNNQNPFSDVYELHSHVFNLSGRESKHTCLLCQPYQKQPYGSTIRKRKTSKTRWFMLHPKWQMVYGK